MQYLLYLVVVTSFVFLLVARPCGPESQFLLKRDVLDKPQDGSTLIYRGNINEGETLRLGDRYLYQRMASTDNPAIKDAEKQYLQLVDELRGFASGDSFRFGEFQLRVSQIKLKLDMIHVSVKLQSRYRKLEDYYDFAIKLLSAMKAAAASMSRWTDRHFQGVNLIYELQELRVLALASFDANGFPDVHMKGYKEKVQSLDWKWSLLKAGYENLEDKALVHDLFLVILGQVRITIDLLLKAQDKMYAIAAGNSE